MENKDLKQKNIIELEGIEKNLKLQVSKLEETVKILESRKSEYLDLQEEIDVLNTKVLAILKEKKKTEDSLEKTKLSSELENKALNELVLEHQEIEGRLQNYKNEIVSCETKIGVLNIDIGIKQKDLSALTEKFNKEKEFIVEKRKHLEENIVELGKQEKAVLVQIELLENQYEKTNKLVTEVGGYVSAKTLEKTAIIQEVSELVVLKEKINLEIKSERESFDEEKKSYEAAYQNRILVIEEREGNASLKESWIKEKEDMLREAKQQLEKHFGRRIPHVNI